MDAIERNEALLLQIESAVSQVWQTYRYSETTVQNCLKQIQEVLQEFLGRVEEFTGMGVEIPVDVITAQLLNMLRAMEEGDQILLADTLQYEIKNTLLFYTDILREIEKEKEN